MNDTLAYILALAPSAASVISIIIGAVKIRMAARKNDEENYQRFTRIAAETLNLTNDLKKLKEANSESRNTIRSLLSQNERLLKELKAEREARTGVKED